MDESDNQQFCLKWNNFRDNIMSQFEALKEDEDFVDVTLSCHGQSLKAHKVVLSACSPYLKNIFKEHPCKHPVIILDNLSFNDLESLIAFVYTGQVYVAQAELPSFLRAAETLQIRGLTESTEAQTILQADLPHVPGNDKPKKRSSEWDAECEMKKFSYKKVVRRTSAHFPLDTDNLKPNKEKDWSSDGENNKPEGSTGSNSESSPNMSSIAESRIEGEERGMHSISSEMDITIGENRKPHSLDPRPCPLCNRVYSNLSNLRQHMRLIHNPTVVTCKLCSKTFKTDLYLRRHLVSFHEVNLNVNSFVSIEPFKPTEGQPSPFWNHNVKTEPGPFKEVFNTNDMYQVPD